MASELERVGPVLTASDVEAVVEICRTERGYPTDESLLHHGRAG
jgi:hypothetical protein